MTDEGENGKHNNKNNGPKPCLLSQLVTFFTCLFLVIALKIGLFPSLRIIKKTKIDPRLEPIQENKKPFNKPYAAPFASTNTINGKNGKKASVKGSKIPGSGPSLS